jgi:hypothetical protein
LSGWVWPFFDILDSSTFAVTCSRVGGNLFLVSVSGAQNAFWFRGLAKNQITNGNNGKETVSPCALQSVTWLLTVTVDRLEFGFGSRCSGVWFRVSGVGCGVWGCGSRVPGPGFRVSVCGFRVLGLAPWSCASCASQQGRPQLPRPLPPGDSRPVLRVQFSNPPLVPGAGHRAQACSGVRVSGVWVQVGECIDHRAAPTHIPSGDGQVIPRYWAMWVGVPPTDLFSPFISQPCPMPVYGPRQKNKNPPPLTCSREYVTCKRTGAKMGVVVLETSLPPLVTTSQPHSHDFATTFQCPPPRRPRHRRRRLWGTHRWPRRNLRQTFHPDPGRGTATPLPPPPLSDCLCVETLVRLRPSLLPAMIDISPCPPKTLQALCALSRHHHRRFLARRRGQRRSGQPSPH